MHDGDNKYLFEKHVLRLGVRCKRYDTLQWGLLEVESFLQFQGALLGRSIEGWLNNQKSKKTVAAFNKYYTKKSEECIEHFMQRTQLSIAIEDYYFNSMKTSKGFSLRVSLRAVKSR